MTDPSNPQGYVPNGGNGNAAFNTSQNPTDAYGQQPAAQGAAPGNEQNDETQLGQFGQSAPAYGTAPDYSSHNAAPAYEAPSYDAPQYEAPAYGQAPTEPTSPAPAYDQHVPTPFGESAVPEPTPVSQPSEPTAPATPDSAPSSPTAPQSPASPQSAAAYDAPAYDAPAYGAPAPEYGQQNGYTAPAYGQPAYETPYEQAQPNQYAQQASYQGQNGYGQPDQYQNGSNGYGQQPAAPAYGQDPYAAQTAPQAPAYGQQPYGSAPQQPDYGQQNGYAQAGYDQNGYGQQPPQYGSSIPTAPAPQASAYGQQNPYGAPGMPTPPQGYGAPATNGAIPLDANGEPPLWAPWYGITFPNAFLRVFKKYATFTGRASRGEYWWWILATVVVSLLFSILTAATRESGIVSALETVWSLGTLVPGIAVGVRRLHDTNRSGWLILLPYGIAFLGFILVIAGIFTGVFSAAGNSAGGLGGGIALIVFGALVVIGGSIAMVVLMAAKSNPEGAKYDRPQA
ncbi:DUF805 domain-containing protein [Bifidobacterium sp. SMB2]|uniref:DUF805 domain-containing protein n=1 Tax=Bifidobacterium saimiriisciurei TaxID=2661627 RepID=A0ABX0CHU0_9BIFI|nr:MULTISPECIES: DUF805 domain-containing protein [Bifidobacterium]NEG96245.1 DUF805 domain-containing protein [Bifidobacterium sp. SMB2]NEH12258.1 DUF805 domain-containing protein [Bifidobacterium saimiriisciurei]